jgi:hypothetical protein
MHHATFVDASFIHAHGCIDEAAIAACGNFFRRVVTFAQF